MKKLLLLIFICVLGIPIISILLYSVTTREAEPIHVSEKTIQEISYEELETVPTVQGETELAIHLINSSLQTAVAFSTNDFETLKTLLASNTIFDETNETVTFPSLEIPLVVEMKTIQPFELRDLVVNGFDVRDGIDPIVILRINHHSYEVMFSKDKASGEYRVISFIGNR